MKPNIDETVREIAIHHPGSVRVFESLGIDYCCGGKRSLEDACQCAHVPLAEVLRLLSDADHPPSEGAGAWTEVSIGELCRHIVARHHGYVRRESSRLVSMFEKVVARHGASRRELKSIRELFAALGDELLTHMMKEENVLFPHLVRMEEAVSEGRPMPRAIFGSVEVPITRMLADHDDAGALAARIRALSGDFHPPEGACPTYRALYRGLEEFERDLHQHVHLENNILFPRALELERKDSFNVRF